MADQAPKRPNPYLDNKPRLNKRPTIALESNKAQLEGLPAPNLDETPTLGSKSGSHFYPPTKKEQTPSNSDRFLYGNYTSYYGTRRNASISHDLRLAALDGSLFTGKTILDIGCNSGNITIAIARACKPKHILGVDIDESLIQRAIMQQRTVYSLQKPDQTNDDDTTPPSMTMDVRLDKHYFPTSMVAMFGNVSMNVPPTYKSDAYPFNLTFEAGDWMDMDTKKDHYDTILALSITKWIQLHRGDDGLKTFFRKIHQSLKQGGVFVLEPQAFTTFTRRAKLAPELMHTLENIQFTPEKYHSFMMFDLCYYSYEKIDIVDEDAKGFSRPLYLYTK